MHASKVLFEYADLQAGALRHLGRRIRVLRQVEARLRRGLRDHIGTLVYGGRPKRLLIRRLGWSPWPSCRLWLGSLGWRGLPAICCQP